MHFLFQLKGMQEVTKEVAHGKKNHTNANKSCQIALFSSKSATESLKPYTVFFSTECVD